ncbi:NHL repeat-containing protein [Candidatus Haliotispira prima]|uniref:NHL repeat-containing protein n=1 Tax=Candidatus Haliotispira prima TaxID=3034016 RepID=A0ABY8MKY5_9SPIO|nr:NHL repeat-containing protein [Candidatus Haliotispira prima]
MKHRIQSYLKIGLTVFLMVGILSCSPELDEPRDSNNPDTENPGTGDPDTGSPGTGDPDTGSPGTGDPDTSDPTPGPPEPPKTLTGIIVSTLAGSGTNGYLDETGTVAEFSGPRGLALDSAGNLYVADTNNHRVRKVTPDGVVTTLAGSTGGYLDATGTAAKLNSPRGIAIGPAGNLYVTGAGNHRIRKMTLAGVVTTVAGAGTIGVQDGTASSAQFNSPSGIAVDSSGNVYVADTSNDKIRKITPAGIVTTVAEADATVLDQPFSVAADSRGNVYVADSYNHKIRKITAGGTVTTFAGSATGHVDRTGTDAKFNYPYGVVLDSSDNVYVADTGNNVIRKITPAGVVTTIAGVAGTSGYKDGTGAEAEFKGPRRIAIDSSGNLYVSDWGNHRIRKITFVYS